jgi:hypothetical protein
MNLIPKFPIAQLKLVKVVADGRRIPVEVTVGQPFHELDRDMWCCQVQLAGIDDRVRNICGDDSLQALCLALRCIRSQLETVIQLGGRVIDAEEGTDIPLEAYFGKPAGELS